MWKDGYTKTVSVKCKTAKSHIHQESSNGESNKTQKNTRKETGQKPTHVVTAMTYSDTGLEEDQEGFFPTFKYTHSSKTFPKQTVPTSMIKKGKSKASLPIPREGSCPLASMLIPPESSSFVSGLLLRLNVILFLK